MTRVRRAPNGDLHLDDMLPYLMNRLVARLNQNLTEHLRKRGFTFQNWRVLAVLAAHEGANLTELAEAAVIPQPSISRIVADLSKRGLVMRESGQNDSRNVHLFLTSKGRAVYDKMRPLAAAEYRAAMRGFTAAEYGDLRRALLRMMQNRKVKLLR